MASSVSDEERCFAVACRFQKSHSLNINSITPDSILLIRLGRLGDVILVTPLLRALHQAFPAAEIDWVVKQEYAELLHGQPGLHRVIPLDTSRGAGRVFELLREIRPRRYDLVLDLHGNPRSYIISGLSGADQRRRARKWSLRRRLLTGLGINLLQNAPSVAWRYFTAVQDLGVAMDHAPPELRPGAEACRHLESLLAPLPRPRIGLAPGASRFTKRWPAAAFAEAGAGLAQRFSGSLVLVGGGEDRGAAEEVRRRLPEGVPVLDLTGRLSLPQAVAAIQGLDLLLSNDTGLMHVATAVNTSVVAVFGPTTRELGFFPLGPAAVVVEHPDLRCRPCSLHGSAACPRGHFRCMLELSSDRVRSAAEKFLAPG